MANKLQWGNPLQNAGAASNRYPRHPHSQTAGPEQNLITNLVEVAEQLRLLQIPAYKELIYRIGAKGDQRAAQKWLQRLQFEHLKQRLQPDPFFST